MSDYVPSKAAVEAAARAIAECDGRDGADWQDVLFAKRALSAAVPVVLAEALAPLRELADEYDEIGSGRIPPYEHGCDVAEELRTILDALPGGEQA